MKSHPFVWLGLVLLSSVATSLLAHAECDRPVDPKRAVIFVGLNEAFIERKAAEDAAFVRGASAVVIEGLRCMMPGEHGEFMGYGVGTTNLTSPAIDWCGKSTSIQITGVNQDFGTFDDPDTFYAAHGSNLTGFRRWLFRAWIRHVMNRRVVTIRAHHGGAMHSRHDAVAPSA